MITEEGRDSRSILKAMTPKVIIAGSGMMSGGRIMHHAYNYLSDSSTRILFVGYQAEETMGRAILEGAKSVHLQKKQIRVKAKISEIKTLSSHADQPKLMTWLTHIQGIKKVFLTHGENPQRSTLAERIRQERSLDVVLPTIGDILPLDSA